MSAKVQQPRHNEKKYEKLTKIVFIICIIGKLHEHAFPNNFQMNARLIIQRNSGSKFHI